MLVKILKELNSKRVNTILDLKNYLNFIKSKITNKKSIKTHYARVNNFGDQFNNDLVQFFGYNIFYTRSYIRSEVALTGSILGAYQEDYEGYVLGASFLKSNFKRLNN